MENDFINNDFDLSVILAFYNRLEIFKSVLPKNAPFFQRNGIEVIISLDSGNEEEGLISLIKNYPFINWKIIVNDVPHSWRNPCKAWNVGIKHATKKYIMVVDPECEMYSDVILKLRWNLEYYSNHYAVGSVVFLQDYDNDIKNAVRSSYGSIMALRTFFFQISGYSEYYSNWGGEDDNLRAKFEYLNVARLYIDDALVIHRENSSDGLNGWHKRIKQSMNLQQDIYHRSFYPITEDFVNTNWGEDFYRIAYDYQNNVYQEELAIKYLSDYEKYCICTADTFTKPREIVALIQNYNEISHLSSLLEHLKDLCDGVILFDDGSTDGSFEKSISDNLLLKFQKQRGEKFNDLKNRNILLDIAAFVPAQWFFFIDTDERFDKRYCDLRLLVKETSKDVFSFWVANLWDHEDQFWINNDETNNNQQSNGLWKRFRLFRNKGASQIFHSGNYNLHFSCSPYLQNLQMGKILLLHYGTLKQSDRKKKYEFYKENDPIGATNSQQL